MRYGGGKLKFWSWSKNVKELLKFLFNRRREGEFKKSGIGNLILKGGK